MQGAGPIRACRVEVWSKSNLRVHARLFGSLDYISLMNWEKEENTVNRQKNKAKSYLISQEKDQSNASFAPSFKLDQLRTGA